MSALHGISGSEQDIPRRRTSNLTNVEFREPLCGNVDSEFHFLALGRILPISPKAFDYGNQRSANNTPVRLQNAIFDDLNSPQKRLIKILEDFLWCMTYAGIVAILAARSRLFSSHSIIVPFARRSYVRCSFARCSYALRANSRYPCARLI